MFVVWFFVKGEKVLEMRVCYKYIVYIIYIKKDVNGMQIDVESILYILLLDFILCICYKYIINMHSDNN